MNATVWYDTFGNELPARPGSWAIKTQGRKKGPDGMTQIHDRIAQRINSYIPGGKRKNLFSQSWFLADRCECIETTGSGVSADLDGLWLGVAGGFSC